MYDVESVSRRIKSMGVTNFVKMISASDFSPAIKKELEKINIFKNGQICLSAIYLLSH